MTEIIIAIIAGIFGLAGEALVFIVNIKKLKNDQTKMFADQVNRQNEMIESFKKEITETLTRHKETYLEQISEVHSTVTEIKAENQQYQATMDIRMDHMAEAFNDMKIEVREHNNFARRMPVVEEKISVANHRIDDLEEANKRNSNDGK